MIIGGKLGIGSEDEVAQTERLLSAGFTAVFADGTSLDSFQKFVLSLPAPGSGVTRSLDSGVRAVEAAW
ncbi:hypothetical protein GA0070623_0006 [Micromonospora rifamycinica]|uniref:Uncharacterized protein n=2 Tax=Micromonospora rifamycinica TaxID=291594 RepID=A0A1C5GLU2_9ACTN|nr:hypothetical protein GA0070623_0006 [Micromonospora rifamycinica]